MARRKGSTTADDWYLISVDRLKQIGLVAFLLLLGGGVWFYMSQVRGDPRSTAQSAIAAARQALNALAASPQFATRQTEFTRAEKKLEEATSLFDDAKYPEAEAAAVESQTISKGAGTADVENDARFLTVEGDVQYQKGSSSEWKRADLRTALVNGDWVKTGDNASAELMFQNGSLYTIGPNALLEIYSSTTPGSTKKTNAVQMQVGSVEVATVSAGSTVRTPGSQVVLDSESTTQVGIGRDKVTSIVTTRGSASVAPASGGQAVRVAAGEKVTAAPTGTLSSVSKLVMPPALVSPADNQVFTAGADQRMTFSWQPQPSAVAYQIQLSRSRLFSAHEINARRDRTSVEAKLSTEGTFYWRVASIGFNGDMGPFSPFRRFRVSGGSGSSAAVAGDVTPPNITFKAPFNIGGPFYIIEGTTEAGATVFINDEEVDVDSRGSFKKLVSFNKVGQNAVVIKAVDPAGNQTVKSQTVMVEE